MINFASRNLFSWVILGLVLMVCVNRGEGLSAQESPDSEQTQPVEEAPTLEGEGVTEEELIEEQAAVEPTTVQPSSEGLISVDFKDADIRQVLRILSLKSGVDIVAGPNVEALVTIKLTNVPWEQALDVILRTYGLAHERKGNIVRVMTKEDIDIEVLDSAVYLLNYAKAKEVTEIVKEMLSDRGKVKFDERTNTVIITDIPPNLSQLKQIIAQLDAQTPQVLIESKIVETKLTKDDNLGIDWFNSVSLTLDPAIVPTTFPFPGGASLGNIGEEFVPMPGSLDPTTGAVITQGRIPQVGGKFTFGTLDPGASLNATINMLKQRVSTNIVSNPTIMTLNNKQAIVQVGEDINIPNFQIDASTGRATVTGVSVRATGVILKVTPYVNSAQEIVMDLSPEITEIGSTFDEFASGVKFPRFTVQKATTQVRMRDGQTLVIGGLVKRKQVTTQDKVPVLGDIPVLGLLFTNTRHQTDPHQDLLIFITVKLVDETVQPPATVAAQP